MGLPRGQWKLAQRGLWQVGEGGGKLPCPQHSPLRLHLCWFPLNRKGNRDSEGAARVLAAMFHFPLLLAGPLDTSSPFQQPTWWGHRQDPTLQGAALSSHAPPSPSFHTHIQEPTWSPHPPALLLSLSPSEKPRPPAAPGHGRQLRHFYSRLSRLFTPLTCVLPHPPSTMALLQDPSQPPMPSL